MYTNLKNGQSGNATLGNLGGINASQLGYGSVVSSVSTNFGTSNGQYTGNDLDCMIDGPGFFIVGPFNEPFTTPAASGNEGEFDLSRGGAYFSRVGIFSPDANGYLVDDSGNYVYGFAPSGEVDENGKALMDLTQMVPIKIPIDPESAMVRCILSFHGVSDRMVRSWERMKIIMSIRLVRLRLRM